MHLGRARHGTEPSVPGGSTPRSEPGAYEPLLAPSSVYGWQTRLPPQSLPSAAARADSGGWCLRGGTHARADRLLWACVVPAKELRVQPVASIHGRSLYAAETGVQHGRAAAAPA